MTIRYTTKPEIKFGVSSLPSGYESPQADSNISIPSVGIVDVDRALFKLFDKEIKPFVSSEDSQKAVPIVFAAGEKWALLKKGRALRDRNNTIILPIITIGRTSLQQSPTDDIGGRGINQHVGELHIQRRLDATDRSYQSLINRLLLPNQDNLALTDAERASTNDGPIVSRAIGDLATNPTIQEGGLLLMDRRQNVFETLVVPTPQFVTALYTITVWTQYQTHMNQVLEQLLSSFLPQERGWRIETESGYWFVATMSDDTFTPQNNFDDMSSEERMIKCEFNLKVPAYIFASEAGNIVPIRRFVSSPEVNFVVSMPQDAVEISGIDDPFLGADDPTLPLTEKTRRSDGRDDRATKLFPNSPHVASSTDPALRGRNPAQYRKITGVDSNGKKITKYIKILKINKSTGEVIYAPTTDLGGIFITTLD